MKVRIGAAKMTLDTPVHLEKKSFHSLLLTFMSLASVLRSAGYKQGKNFFLSLGRPEFLG